MDRKLENAPRGFSNRVWSVVAVVLTAGLALSLAVMLYALVTGLARRFQG